MMVTAKTLRAAATSVDGARAMGIETAASKAAPALLAAADAWLKKNEAGAAYERRWQDLDVAASALRAAIAVDHGGVGHAPA